MDSAALSRLFLHLFGELDRLSESSSSEMHFGNNTHYQSASGFLRHNHKITYHLSVLQGELGCRVQDKD